LWLYYTPKRGYYHPNLAKSGPRGPHAKPAQVLQSSPFLYTSILATALTLFNISLQRYFSPNLKMMVKGSDCYINKRRTFSLTFPETIMPTRYTLVYFLLIDWYCVVNFPCTSGAVLGRFAYSYDILHNEQEYACRCGRSQTDMSHCHFCFPGICSVLVGRTPA
jgi:hypothetical protein